MKPFNPRQPVQVTKQHLPHWRQDGTTYFITSRLIDSVPVPLANDWKQRRGAWLTEHQATRLADLAIEFHLDYHRLFTDTFHQLLDAGYGECHLRSRAVAQCLIDKMLQGHGTCFQLGAWCVMPNHFHAIVEPAKGSVLGDIVQHWKGGSAFLTNQMLHRKGTFWQKEPFDHIVRSQAQHQRLSQYVADNPRSANLQEGFVLGFATEMDLTREQLGERVWPTALPFETATPNHAPTS